MATEPRRPASLRLVAVLALFTFGCVTVRAPASTIGEEVPLRSGRAEPQLELWVEGNAQVPPEEVAAAAAEARAALDDALAIEGGGQVDPGEDWILVARARGVARTPARRHEQTAAKVGIVLGAVVLVALIVVAVVAGGKGGGGKGGGSPGAGAVGHGARPAGAGLGHLAGSGAARLPPFTGGSRSGLGLGLSHGLRPPPPVVRPPALGRPGLPGQRPWSLRPPGPSPRHGRTGWGGEVDLDLWWWGPVEGPPPLLVEEDQLAWRELPGEAGPAPAADGTTGPNESIHLSPPPPLPVEARGYFDGDLLEVELTLVDRETGLAAWRKVARGEIDPRKRGRSRSRAAAPRPGGLGADRRIAGRGRRARGARIRAGTAAGALTWRPDHRRGRTPGRHAGVRGRILPGMRSLPALLLALALPALSPARAEEPAAPPEIYTRWRAGILWPSARTWSDEFRYRARPGLSLGASVGLPLGPHLALEGALGYATAVLEQRDAGVSGPRTSVDDLSIAGRVVGRIRPPWPVWQRLEVAASAGLALHHPSVANIPDRGPDVALGGEVGLRAAWQVWPIAAVGVEAVQTIYRPRIAGHPVRLDALHLGLTLGHRW